MRWSLIGGALAVIGLAASALVSVGPAFAGDRLTIIGWGGATQAAQRKVFFDPFTKATAIKVTEGEWVGEIAKIRAMVQSKTVSWDVVDSVASKTILMCDEGLLETIDWKKLGLDRSQFLNTDKHDCGVPTFISATVVAYDKDKLANGPKTIADLFDLQKFPGKRGLEKNPLGNLEWALIADGVAIKDVYKVLNTPEGVDRAFKKLDTIKNDVIWWAAGSQAVQLLADGQVVMTSAYMSRVYDSVRNSGKHFEMMWHAAQEGLSLWVIPKGSPRLDDAYKFIAFAATAQKQADLTRYIPFSPANKDGMALVDPSLLPDLPGAPDHVANAVMLDPDFWNEKGEELNQRFTTWLAK